MSDDVIQIIQDLTLILEYKEILAEEFDSVLEN